MHSDQNQDIFSRRIFLPNLKERIFFRKAFMLILFTNIEGFLLHQIHDIKESGHALRPKSGRFFKTHFLPNLKERIFFLESIYAYTLYKH